MEFLPSSEMKRPEFLLFKRILGWRESVKEILNETVLSTV